MQEMDIMLRKTEQSQGNCSIAIFLLFLFSSFFSAVLLTHADAAPQIKAAKPTSSSQALKQTNNAPDQGKGIRFGVDVDLVMMYTSAFDAAGKFVSGLEQKNFTVYEDGVEQKIASFTQEDVPVTMGILLDLSGSMSKSADKVNNAALAFIRASNPDDQVFLIGINDEAELLQDFTSDIDEIQDSLDNTVVAGGTVLYDGIYLGVEKAHAGNRGKKAIVVITDGEDHTSYFKLDELISKVQESDVQVFCIGFLGVKSEFKRAKAALLRISEETGGKAFFPQDISGIDAIVAEIATDLRSQYSIGYTSSNATRDGSFRRVKIKLSGAKSSDINIRYKRGYFASKADHSLAPKSDAKSLQQ
jgi:Ca-activated chloride channel homolog